MRKKATNKKVTHEYLEGRIKGLKEIGFEPTKWILFCQEMLKRGWSVHLYEARSTYSKYLTVRKDTVTKVVRFSNHKPAYRRESANDCDIWVGARHKGKWITWEQAVEMLEKMYQEEVHNGIANSRTDETNR